MHCNCLRRQSSILLWRECEGSYPTPNLRACITGSRMPHSMFRVYFGPRTAPLIGVVECPCSINIVREEASRSEIGRLKPLCSYRPFYGPVPQRSTLRGPCNSNVPRTWHQFCARGFQYRYGSICFCRELRISTGEPRKKPPTLRWIPAILLQILTSTT